MVFNDQLNMSDIVQTPPLPSATNPPPNGNPQIVSSGVPSSFNRNPSGLISNAHVGGPPTLHTSGGGASRYEVSRNVCQTSRNGQHLAEDTTVSSRNRVERRWSLLRQRKWTSSASLGKRWLLFARLQVVLVLIYGSLLPCTYHKPTGNVLYYIQFFIKSLTLNDGLVYWRRYFFTKFLR